MSFFDDASLAFLPSSGAGKDGKAYSIKPTTGAGDFTFSRGSNLSATRVGPTGLIEKGRENLLLQSNNFDTGWINTNITKTGGQSGYDGSSDAWLLERTNTGGRIQQSVSINGVNTFSVYAKSGTLNWIELLNSSSPFQSAFFDLQNGVIGNVDADTINATINSVGNGWYRCEISLLFSGTTSFRISLANGNGDKSGTSGSIYIQDAQLEIGLAATEVIESGATTGKAGLLEDEPRFDYSGGATCPSLLLEPSRTNVWEYSEYLDYSFASVSSITTTQNTNETLSPEGLYNATKLEGVGSWSLRDFIVGTNTGTWTISCYVKAVNASSNNTFRLSVGGNNFSSNITATSEWQRFDFSVTDGGATAAGILRDSSSNDADLYIYGMQVEDSGSYPTSYIPNHSGGSVTRGADDCDGAGDSSTFNITEGVLYAEIAAFEGSDDVFAISLNDGSASNRIFVSLQSPENTYRAYASSSLGTSNINFTGLDVTTISKIAVKYSSSGFSLWVNGQERGTTTFSGMNALNNFSFDRNGGGELPFYGNAKQVLYFPEALSDADCITLTTL